MLTTKVPVVGGFKNSMVPVTSPEPTTHPELKKVIVGGALTVAVSVQTTSALNTATKSQLLPSCGNPVNEKV